MPPAKTSDNEQQAGWNATAIRPSGPRRLEAVVRGGVSFAEKSTKKTPSTIVADPRFTPL